MTIQPLYHIPTDTITRSSKFYPTKIAVPHYQLRNFISTTKKDYIFYANGHDLCCINLKKNEATLLASLRFEARCLAVDRGWACIGGELNGDCAFVHLQDDEDWEPSCFGHEIIMEIFGGERVNRVSVGALLSDDMKLEEPVALISNNDTTVKIYSLARRKPLATIYHPAPMNYAILSPDSKVLAAVGDSDQVFFYKRVTKTESEEDGKRPASCPEYEWEKLATPDVGTGDLAFSDFGFAITFSPSGRLCAASSQGGCISVFDMEELWRTPEQPEKAILCHFMSSRPELHGCVRSMAFSPGPWDLLAWTEDHGRAGIADVRQSFLRRQILDLNHEESEVVALGDATPTAYRGLTNKEKLKEQQLLTRLRSPRSANTSTSGSSRTDAVTHLLRRQQQREPPFGRRETDLDQRERSVLQALETTIDDLEPARTQPHSVNYLAPRRIRSSVSASIQHSETDAQLLNSRQTVGARTHMPRRTSSVVLSQTQQSLAPHDHPRTRITASPRRMTESDDEVPAMSTNDLTPTGGGSSSQPLPYNIPPSDPWHVIEAAMGTARMAHDRNASTRTPSGLAQIESAIEEERRQAHQLEQELQQQRQISLDLQRRLEMQERLLASERRELETSPEASTRLAPSIESLVQRQMESEQQFGERRIQAIESEIERGSNRTRQLQSEREELLSQSRTNSSVAASSSARTSALPTTNTSSQNDRSESLATLSRQHEDFRRQREAQIEELERQMRHTEERVTQASSGLAALEDLFNSGTFLPWATPQEREEFRARLQTGGNPNNPTITVPISIFTESDHAELAATITSSVRSQLGISIVQQQRAGGLPPPVPPTAGSSASSSLIPARSELAGRITERDMRAARMMFIQGTRAVIDGNGNWMPPPSTQRSSMLSGFGRNESPSTNPSLAATVASIERSSAEISLDARREVGMGTAGLGWSQDGDYLYVGCEDGIFEYKINLRDRMIFPSFEMR